MHNLIHPECGLCSRFFEVVTRTAAQNQRSNDISSTEGDFSLHMDYAQL